MPRPSTTVEAEKISPMLSMSPSDCRNALSFLGELQKLTCRQRSILIDAMRYSPPNTPMPLRSWSEDVWARNLMSALPPKADMD